MPDHDDSNRPSVKNASQTEASDPSADQDDPATAGEALYGGVLKVVKIGDERYGLFRECESPDKGDEPLAELHDRSTAFIAAAFLPLASKPATLRTRRSERGHALYRGDHLIGHLRLLEPDWLLALNIGDAMARITTSLALLEKAVGPAVRQLADKLRERL